MLVLLLMIGCIVVGLVVVVYVYQTPKQHQKQASRWIGPSATSFIRTPPPCHAANPVETPCTATDPLSNFPPAVLTVPSNATKIEVAVVSADHSAVYAVGHAAINTEEGNAVSIPLSLADPIPIRSSVLHVEYVAKIDGKQEIRWPITFNVLPPIQKNTTPLLNINNSGGGFEVVEGQIYHWAVSESERQPLITSTYITPQGSCVQMAEDGAQFVVPVAGILDRFTVYCPERFSNYPLKASLVVNGEGGGGLDTMELDCWHKLNQTPSDKLLKLAAGDRFALRMENAVGDYGYVTTSVRFRCFAN